MKRTLLIIFLLMVSNSGFAKDIPVKIKPEHKITTSNLNLREGDSVDFVISDDVFVNPKVFLKKGQKVSGCVTGIQDNGYLVQPATIYIENFRTKDVKNHPIKLKGVVYKEGNGHSIFTEFFVFELLRGGEVQIKPEKDEFMLYVEDNL